jgi:hypothetical protein
VRSGHDLSLLAPDNVSSVARRAWLVPVATAVAAVALLVAGAVVWRMTSTPGPAPPGSRGITFVYLAPPHRLHPLRAELLWAASALLALVGIRTTLRQRFEPDTAQAVNERS